MSGEKGRSAAEAPKIEIFRAWCKKCGICAAFCPAKVLAQDHDGSPYVANMEACTACRLCEIRCPDFAIKVTGEPRKSKKEGAGGESAEESS